MERVRNFMVGEFQGESRVPFWDKALHETRRQVAKEWLRTIIILCTAIFGILSIFWGCVYNTEEHLKALDVLVVDFDGLVEPYDNVQPFVGPLIVQTAQQAQEKGTYKVTFKITPASQYQFDPFQVRESIYQFDHWAAVIINPNATALLQDAIILGNTSYDPRGACSTIYVTARDQVATMYFQPQLEEFQLAATSAVGTSWARQIISNLSSSANITALAAASQAISPAIGFTTFDLRPFTPIGATPAVSVGLIYLIIVAFFSYSFFMPTHSHFVSAMEGHNKVYFAHLVVWKYCSTVSAYFFLSLAYSLVSLAFGIPFSSPPGAHVEPVSPANQYHHASFVVYWMVNFIGMCALGLPCENMAMLMGQPWTALWLIFWVISNVSTAFYPIVTASVFYTYGYGWPLHSLVEATRVILFNVRSRMGLHIGILLAWWATSTALFPVFAWWFRYDNCVRKKRKQAKKAEKAENNAKERSVSDQTTNGEKSK